MKVYPLIFILILLTACEVNSPGTYTPDNPGGENFGAFNDLFIPSNGGLHLKINDPLYWTKQGYTLLYVEESEETAFKTRESKLTKLSGNNRAGYGLTYCCRIDPTRGLCMLVVFINIQRQYRIGEIVGGTWEDIVPWKESPNLVSGYNVNNRVKLDFNGEDYTFSINGIVNEVFRDDDLPRHTTGKNGYIVTISPLDKFPQVPVEIRFEE